MEIWKAIPGYEGFYEVSNLGRVKSLARMRKGPRVLTRVSEKILTPFLHKHKGYVRHSVCLCVEDQRRTCYIHQLVLLAFVGPPPQGEEGRHLDGDGTNNRLANLAYGTHKKNMEDRRDHGTAAKGARHGRALLTEQQARMVKQLATSGEMTQKQIAHKFGIHQTTVSLISTGRNWGHL